MQWINDFYAYSLKHYNLFHTSGKLNTIHQQMALQLGFSAKWAPFAGMKMVLQGES